MHRKPNGAFRRQVLSSPSGHFKLGVIRNGVGFNTSCISYGASSIAVSNTLQDLNPIHDLGGAVVFRQGDGSSAYNYGFSYEISASNTSESLADSLEIDFIGSGVESGCTRLSTLSYWDDASNWDVNMVPSALDEASRWVQLCSGDDVNTNRRSSPRLCTALSADQEMVKFAFRRGLRQSKA